MKKKVSKKFFNKQIENSPVPVFLFSKKKKPKVNTLKGRIYRKYVGNFRTSGYDGSFIHTGGGRGTSGFPLNFIIINSGRENYKKLLIYYHELGHYYCKNKNCKCENNVVLKELHAYEYCLKKILKKEILPCVTFFVSYTRLFLSNKKNKKKYPYHYKACKKIRSRLLWKKAVSFMRKHRNSQRIENYK